MIKKHKILAIIPCRYSSKRLKYKNFLNYKNKPMFMHTLDHALNSKYVDKVVLSTDTKKIFNYKISNLIDIHIRDKKTTIYDTNVNQVVSEVLKKPIYENLFDILLILYPTSPLRTNNDIDAVIQNLVTSNCKYSLAVTIFNQPFNQALKVFKRKASAIFFKEYHKNPPKNVFVDNGSTYAVYYDEFLKSKKISCTTTAYHIMDYNKSFDINNHLDYQLLLSQ